MIVAPSDLPLKQYPTNSKTYQAELEEYLASLIPQGLQFTGSITKTVGKSTFTVHTLTSSPTIEAVKVIDSSLAGIVNFPTSDKSLAESANARFDQLAAEGWIYSGSYLKKISTSNYTFLVFYRHKKPRAKNP